jgi:hypothetical protein
MGSVNKVGEEWHSRERALMLGVTMPVAGVPAKGSSFEYFRRVDVLFLTFQHGKSFQDGHRRVEVAQPI